MSSTFEIPEGTVTVLFTDLVESTTLNQTLGDDRARQVGREIEAMAERLIETHRGVLIKEMGDGLMAAFASARRAVSCAREIQVEMRKLQLAQTGDAVAMRIGLHTGEVITEDGDIHGETVIIASRIEGLAPPNRVLVSNTVHGVLGTSRDELIDQGETQLKGIDAPWRLWLIPEPEEASGNLTDSDLTPYIGRAEQLAQVTTAVEAAASGRGGIVLVGGEAGSGKSRLTAEMAAVAGRLNMTVRVGHCLDMESPPPYQPVIDQLEQAARELSPEGFRDALGVNAPEIAKLMPTLHQRFDDIAEPPELSPEQERRYMLHGVVEFIDRASRFAPLMLVYEDLHWVDESSILLIRQLAQRVADLPVVIVVTYRSNELLPGRPLSTNLSPLRRDHGAIDIVLRPLDRDEVGAVITARAGMEPPAELLDLVYSESDGNPFFVEEVFKHLRDSGKLFSDDGTWKESVAIGETEVPRNVLLVISRRLDHLDADTRKHLSIAAVIGRWFDFDTLLSVARIDEDQLLDGLEAAEKMNLVAEDDEGAGYVFVHEQIRQALVGEISLVRRQRTHLRVADALEEQAGSSATSIAHHLERAGAAAPPERVAAILQRAAVDAMSALAFEDALLHLDHALETGEADLRVVDSMRAQALRGSGRIEEALAVLEAALHRSDTSPEEAISLRLQRTKLRLDQYLAADALDDIDTVLRAKRGSGDVPGETEALLALGRAHYILSLDNPDNAHDSRDAYQEAYDLAKLHGDIRSMILALLPTSWFTDYWSDYLPTASANITEAVMLANDLNDIDLSLDARSAQMKLAGVHLSLGEAEQVGAELEKRRDPIRLNAHYFWFMWQTYFAAQYEGTVESSEKAIALADILGTPPVQYGSLKALALVQLGRFDEIDSALAEEVTDDDHPFGQAMETFATASLLVGIEAWQPAVAAICDAIDRAITMSRVWMQQGLCNMATIVLIRGGDDLQNRADLQAAIDRVDFRPDALTRAEQAIADGRPDDAVADLNPRTEVDDDVLGHLGLLSLEIVARAHLVAGRPDDAEKCARRGIDVADGCSADTTALHFARALALAAREGGDIQEAATLASNARTRLDTLSDRIREPDLRDWFRRQPLAEGI